MYYCMLLLQPPLLLLAKTVFASWRPLGDAKKQKLGYTRSAQLPKIATSRSFEHKGLATKALISKRMSLQIAAPSCLRKTPSCQGQVGAQPMSSKSTTRLSCRSVFSRLEETLQHELSTARRGATGKPHQQHSQSVLGTCAGGQSAS